MRPPMSPISSRKSVPPLASSKRPRRAPVAPVKLPRAWPNSSLSSTPSAMAPQSTAMNDPCARREAPWIARATSSLPVPDSPTTSTVASVDATRAAALLLVAQQLERLRPVGGKRYLMTVLGEDLRHESSRSEVVVHHQDARQLAHASPA